MPPPGRAAPPREVLVHECGHLFGMGHFNPPPGSGWPPHPDHENHDRSDGCVMVFGAGAQHANDFYRFTAQFGGPTNPPGEPGDLKNGIAGHTDPK